jgi:isocitrate dehydrogenase
MPQFKDVKVPADGQKITISNGKLTVPDRPVVPFIEGDGTGPDIWRASVRVFDAAVAKAYAGKRKIAWMEVFAGQKSFDKYGSWLHDDTVPAFQEFLVGIKGPLTTPVGGGIRSLNVALRQMLDLYVCLRPVQYFKGVPSPVKHPEKVNMTIFRENTEDIYAGHRVRGRHAGGQGGPRLSPKGPKEFKKIRFGTGEAPSWAGAPRRRGRGHAREVGIGIKPVSTSAPSGWSRASTTRSAQAQERHARHKGYIRKFTERRLRDWGHDVARSSTAPSRIGGGPWCKIPERQARGGALRCIKTRSPTSRSSRC